MQRKVGHALLGILVLLAGAEFLWRGPLRLIEHGDFNDFTAPYVQSLAWVRGMDPYSPANLVQLWPSDAGQFYFVTKDLADGSLVYKRGIPTAYPPSCLLLLAPLTILPWKIALHVWLAMSLLTYAMTLVALLSLMDFRESPLAYWFITFALALAPVHTGLALGSIVIVAVGLAALAVWAARHDHSVSAGVLLALAIALKPQISLPFLVYYVVRRRWRLSVISIAVLFLVLAAAAIHLQASGTTWVHSYLLDNKILFAAGSLGDFTELDPLRFGLVNLQIPMYAIFENRLTANVVSVAIAVTLGCLWLFFVSRSSGKDEPLELSAIALISLLPVYHRFYDASLLIFPLAWSSAALYGQAKLFAKGVLLLLIPFLVPGGSALEQLQRTGRFQALQHSRWWTAVIMPHQPWCLFFLSILLLQALRFRASDGASVEERTRSKSSEL
jgi:Glycosyltransferase family 87